MSDKIYHMCPKCKIIELEFSFAGNNGYVAFCKKCQAMFYYCSIFGKVDMFVPNNERFEVDYKQFTYKPMEGMPAT